MFHDKDITALVWHDAFTGVFTTLADFDANAAVGTFAKFGKDAVVEKVGDGKFKFHKVH